MTTGGRIIQSSYQPAWWLPEAHSQTLWPYLFRRKHTLQYTNERLELPDGDFVDCCWTTNTTGPIVAVFHGLEGSIDSPYAAAIMAAIHAQGWRGVFMHFRGCSGTLNRLERSYHSGDTGDIRFLLDTLTHRYPGVPLATIGYSLGGNALLKYLGESIDNKSIAAAVTISVPFVLQDSAKRLARGFSRTYQTHLVSSLCRKVKSKFANKACSIDIDKLDTIKTFYQFDDYITAPLHGFLNAEDYYTRSSCRQYLAGITVPTLILHARNDPFMTPAATPAANELSDNVILELADSGGHVGFVSGKVPWKPVYWLEQRIMAYLDRYMTR